MVDIKFSMFFDKPGVLKRIKDGTKSSLSKAGSFVRTRARSSIRRVKKTSLPGKPPSSHVGTLKRLIFFGYDAERESVVIGPMLFGKRRKPPVPELLEKGGMITRKRKMVPKLTGRVASDSQKKAYHRKLQDGSLTAPTATIVRAEATYRPRPFMEPALKAELPKFPALFTDSII